MNFLDDNDEINDSEIDVISKILQELSKINHKFNIIKNIEFNHKKAVLLIKKNISNHNPTILIDYDLDQKNIESFKSNLLFKNPLMKQNINLPLVIYENKKICDYRNKSIFLTNNISTNIKSMFKTSCKLTKSFSFECIPNKNNCKKQLDSYFNSLRSSLLDFANVSHRDLNEIGLKINKKFYTTHKMKIYNYNIKSDTITSLSDQGFDECFNIID